MAATLHTPSLWTYRKVPYVFDTNFPYEDEAKAAMNTWREASNVWFKERTNEPNYIVFKTATSSDSPVGMQGGAQTVHISDGFKCVHELGHAIGLIHEQCRHDRGSFIDMQWDHIDGGQGNKNFRLIPDSQNLTPYDPGSVMHYPAPASGWGGIPKNTVVSTMLWKADHKRPLGGGQAQGWTNLSAADKSGTHALYQSVPVPMGRETDHSTWNAAYEAGFSYTVGGKVFIYGQNMDLRTWVIHELLPNGKMGSLTDHAKWPLPYQVQFPYTIGGKVFLYQQTMDNNKNWSIEELLPDGKMGPQTEYGFFDTGYRSQVLYMVGNRMFICAQNLDNKNWFIRELLPNGKMGTQINQGTWQNAYEVMFSYSIGNRVFIYGQNLNELSWFISEMQPDGNFGTGTDSGTWKNAYKVQFPYNINGHQYFYAQNLDTKYWFIQRLNADGTMGEELQNGFWKFSYGSQFPFQIAGRQFFYGQNFNELNWFIQELIDVK